MRQRIELTGTNCSIGLNALINSMPIRARARVMKTTNSFASQFSVFGRPGGICEGPEPDPIPNSAVKLLRANGTKSQDLEE